MLIYYFKVFWHLLGFIIFNLKESLIKQRNVWFFYKNMIHVHSYPSTMSNNKKSNFELPSSSTW